MAAFGVAGVFVSGEFSRGGTVATAAGGVFGVVCGLGVAGVRTRLLDVVFPPGRWTRDRAELRNADRLIRE